MKLRETLAFCIASLLWNLMYVSLTRSTSCTLATLQGLRPPRDPIPLHRGTLLLCCPHFLSAQLPRVSTLLLSQLTSRQTLCASTSRGTTYLGYLTALAIPPLHSKKLKTDRLLESVTSGSHS